MKHGETIHLRMAHIREDMNMIDANPGYVVIPLEGGIPFYAVLAPDGSILSEHKRLASALSKARRLNRQQYAKSNEAKPRVKRTPNGRHLYAATMKGYGTYGWGNTPSEARAKLFDNIAKSGEKAAGARQMGSAIPGIEEKRL